MLSVARCIMSEPTKLGRPRVAEATRPENIEGFEMPIDKRRCHHQATVSHRFQIGFRILMPVRLVPLRTYRLKRLSQVIT